MSLVASYMPTIDHHVDYFQAECDSEETTPFVNFVASSALEVLAESWATTSRPTGGDGIEPSARYT